MICKLGTTKTFQFTFQRRVDGVLTWWNPDQIVVSLLKTASSGTVTEDAITYAGTDPRDDDLVKTSDGHWELSYVLDVIGEWCVSATGTDVNGSKTWPCKQPIDVAFTVNDDPHTNADIPASEG